MCDVFEIKRGFVLPPQALHKKGELIVSVITDFQLLQNRFSGELEIVFRKGGGFIVFFPDNMDPEDLFDDTHYLHQFLDTAPHIIDLARAA